MRPLQGPSDTLSRLLDDLCRPGALERATKDNERALAEFVEAEARDLSPEAFTKFMADIYYRIATLIKSPDPNRKLGALLAIDELIEKKAFQDDAVRTSGFSGLLRRLFEECEELALLEVGAQALGKLVKSSGPNSADIVDRQVRACLPWLDPGLEPSEARRYAAVLILREMAEAAPAVFNVHVKPFLDAIWGGLRDPRRHVREASVAALKSCLVLVEQRETRYRVQWYYQLFEATMRSLARDARSYAPPAPEAIHGALLALGELLGHTGEFLLARYREVVEVVMRYKDSREKLIRRAVIALLPRLAAFAPERFAQDYLSKSLAHLLSVLKLTSERGAAFEALADMATSAAAVGCGAGFAGSLDAIGQQIRETLTARGKAPREQVNRALQCCGALAAALRGLWAPHATALLDAMVLTGPSETLVQSLALVAGALPELLEDIQGQLLDLLSLMLARKPFCPTTDRAECQALLNSLAGSELVPGAAVQLALNTLGTFDFGKVSLLEFMRDHMVGYLDDTDKGIRQAAALACCRVLERHAPASAALRRGATPGANATAGTAAPQPDPCVGAGGANWGALTPVGASSAAAAAAAAHLAAAGTYLGHQGGLGGAGALGLSVKQAQVVEKVVGKLLLVAVADTSEGVRRAVLKALCATPALDSYLAQADCLRPLFVALNDPSVAVRATAVRLVGRLAAWNGAYVSPALRRYLLQLLLDMEASPDSKAREEAAYLLDCLIQSAPQLIMPYVSPIQKALVAKLRGGSLSSAAAAPAPPSVALAAAAAAATPASSGTPGTMASASGGALMLAPGGPLTGPLTKEPKQGGAEVAVMRSVLATLGQLAAVSGAAFKPHVSEVMPLVIEAIQDAGNPRKRLTAVRCLGQICQSSGAVMSPYWDFPQLLALLLRLLHEGSSLGSRREVMKVLGIIGALDPHTHKTNTASLSGEGKLELEGVRPLRHNKPLPVVGASLVPGTLGAAGGEDAAADLLPAAGLVTSSEDYYPTVAINALMRVLRDPALASQHQAVISALMAIFRALGAASVPYLPKVLPVLFAVLRGAGEPLVEYSLEQLCGLVACVRAHIRRFLGDLLDLLGELWGGGPRILAYCLQLLAELALSLRDDLRPYVPDLLPRFVALLVEAERSCCYDMVRPALAALEALGLALDEHLHLLLPSLLRLVSPAAPGTPLEVRRAVLRGLRRLLPRLQLAGHSSALMQPLMRLLEGPPEELRREALDTICALALALGPDFAIFAPSLIKIVGRNRIQHEWFERLVGKVLPAEPPCMCGAEDWEAAGGWAAELDAVAAANPAAAAPLAIDQGPAKLAGDFSALRKAWESSARVTKEDWAEWMRHFSVELLGQSPSPALRACHALAQGHPAMARELFAAGFVSCWAELDAGSQDQLVRSLEAALAAPTIPPEIVTALLNLAEFMEHDDKRLPLDTRTLGALAEKCHAFAKALHYKELEFGTSPATAIEALIHINNQLRQPEAATGILAFAQKHMHLELKEGWYEKLCRWDEALEAYERRLQREEPNSHEYHTALLGKMRCLASLAEWEQLSGLCRTEWRKSEPHMRKEMAVLAAHAAWHMGAWGEMEVYVDTLDGGGISATTQAAGGGNGGSNGMLGSRPQGPGAGLGAAAKRAGGEGGGPQSATAAILRTVLCLRHEQYEAAQANIDRARELMSTDLAALVGESYERAYTDMVRVQQLTELEEVAAYKRALGRVAQDPAGAAEQIAFIRELWRKRLLGVQRHVEVWQSLFSVRSLVVGMHEDPDSWLKFAALCRKNGRPRQARQMLVALLRYDPRAIPSPDMRGYGAGSGAPAVMLAYVKHLWATGGRREALSRLNDLVVKEISAMPATPQPFVRPDFAALAAASAGAAAAAAAAGTGGVASSARKWGEHPKPPLVARAYLRLGLYDWHIQEARLEGDTIPRVMGRLRAATEYGGNWSKAWHHWALFNCSVLEHLVNSGEGAAAPAYVAPAVTGFFRSVALGQASGERPAVLQDILRLLTLWFTWGAAPDVEAALVDGFSGVSIDTWLGVIPQIIARIHTNNPQVRGLIYQLLVRIGRAHPQSLMYPLLVAAKSQSGARREAAWAVLDHIRQHSPTLVEQAQLVSSELIRIAILWHEQWHEALEEASRLYFGESNVEGMLGVLLPLHEMMEANGPTTLKEIAFVQAYGRELSEAYEWLLKYRASRKDAELHQAWDLYYHVFKKINKQLHALTQLELQYVAPALVRAQGMELAVPGTYIAGEPLVTIAAFAPQLQVISSKQRPRKLTIHGGDGAEYMFLLKGHEDLRQDERVMQLFGLVNSLLAADRTTAERDLSIARYAVIPLSPNSGLIGWVPNCDTLHALIREYREGRKIPLNWEHRLMLGMAPDYDHLPVINKVEVFEHALDSTSGEDLHKVLWLKSRNSEVWLERRTAYTRSGAVMSMVGYLLGLGDRHPSNLMLDRYSGKLLHIDFGDCFEASMNRDKFPEKVPFRLTRMMIKAMEVSGIEGNFRSTAEAVLRVLRMHKDSVMAMLEAFVHDPLINWRLLNTTEAATEAALGREANAAGGGAAAGGAAAGGAGAGGGGAPGQPGAAAGVGGAAGGAGGGGGGGHGGLGGPGPGGQPLEERVLDPVGRMPSPPQRGARERELREARDQLAGDASEVLNERAVAVMKRMSDKLVGRDYAVEGLAPAPESDSVAVQVQRLIAAAVSHENLCQSYIGWCPFW